MEPFEVFEHNLQETLHHIYDPAYRPPDLLWQTLHIPREQGMPALRDAIIAAIEELKPPAQVPLTTRAWRVYGMLHYRYIVGLSQEATAEKLAITARHLRRSYAEAVHALSLALWEKHAGPLPATAPVMGAPVTGAPVTGTPVTGAPVTGTPGVPIASEWQEQLVRELEALADTDAGAVAQVDEVFAGVARLASHLIKDRTVALQPWTVAPDLMVAMHPSALRHILISIVSQLANNMPAGAIQLAATPQAGKVHITIGAAPLQAAASGSFQPMVELLASFDIASELTLRGGNFELSMDLLEVDRCVLVVDDNPDMAHLYRRYLVGTRYYLQHVNLGASALGAIDLYQPDVVVLDVMLPDIDGWDLLTRLHEHPTMRTLPVIICSVMPEQQLALALGARYFLAKPVARPAFIAALDAVLATG
jgi:CheY-like chemotaxis protein